jgi:hypothetical protein
MIYNWKDRTARWLIWKDGFGCKLEPDETIHYIVVDLDETVQFPKLDGPPPETRVVVLQYKTPAFATGRSCKQVLDNIHGVVVRMVEHLLPAGTYGPGRPLEINWLRDSVTMKLPDGTHINIKVEVKPPEGTRHQNKPNGRSTIAIDYSFELGRKPDRRAVRFR